MKTMLLAAGFAASTLIFAAPASAAIGFTFDGGLNAPSAGYTVINNFNSPSDDSAITGNNFQIKFPPADGNGAPPADGSKGYLSVLGGGSATITFAKPVSSFQFDWGSVDSYNSLVITSNSESETVVPGSMNFTNPANGDQVSPGTNGLFTVTGSPGETFTSITLSSSSNSFEIDNLAVAGVPEPANWALMIVGFGAIGAMSRRRRSLGAATA
jgi:hypothetical protein